MEEKFKKKRVAYIRFNTDYPKGRKWRILNENLEEMQVNEFIIEGCYCTSSTDVMPSGEIKHHVKVEYEKLLVINDIANFINYIK